MEKQTRVSGNVLLLFMMVALVGGVWAYRSSGDTVGWRDNLEAARTEARSSNKPLVVYFTADWCPPCQQMKKTTWADSQVTTALGSYVPVKIDVDAQPQVAQQFQVRSIPFVVVLDRSERVVGTRAGLVDASSMTQWLDASR
jgi:thioredoxin-like negative regulator of GroEL